jgi:hypothetical protein
MMLGPCETRYMLVRQGRADSAVSAKAGTPQRGNATGGYARGPARSRGSGESERRCGSLEFESIV